MIQTKVVRTLPATLYREIGRVICSFARLEFELSNVIYALLPVGPKEGRLAVREPRATDRLEIIGDLLALRRIDSIIDLSSIKPALERVAIERDRLAHGIWVEHPRSGELLLRVTKGKWQPTKGQRGKTKRVIKPEAIRFNVEDCRTLHTRIEGVILGVEEIGQQVRRALGS